jgi:hypothetical protein
MIEQYMGSAISGRKTFCFESHPGDCRSKKKNIAVPQEGAKTMISMKKN